MIRWLMFVGCTGSSSVTDGAPTEPTAPVEPTDDTTAPIPASGDTGEAPEPDPLAPPDDGWAWQNPLPHGHVYNDVWVHSPDFALAVGNGQVLSRWQDGAWDRIGLPLDYETTYGRFPGFTPDYWSVHGWSATEIVIGALYGPVTWDGDLDADVWSSTLLDDPTPQNLWGHAPDALWALGGQGSWFYDSKWTQVPQPFMSGYQGIWGTGPNDVFAVGWLGRMNQFDGTAWTQHLTGSLDDVLGVWTAGPDATVWVAGESGTIFGFDRNTLAFTPVVTGVPDSFRDVWGASESDVWAVGDGGTIFHYDGTTWTAQDSGTDQALYAAFGSSSSDVWAVGAYGVIVHYDGTAWSTADGVSGPYDDLVDVSMSSGTDGWAVGGEDALVHFDGTSWTRQTAPLEEPRSVYAASASDVWMINETQFARYDGTSWATEPFPDSERLRHISGGGGRVVAGGRDLWEQIGGAWEKQADSTGFGEQFWSVHVNPDGQAFAAGSNDVVYSPSVGTWVDVPFPWFGDATVLAVWGSSSTDIYAGGQYGLYRYDGVQWVRLTDSVPNAPDLVTEIWGTGADDIWVSSYTQGAWHWNGKAWTRRLDWTFRSLSSLQGVPGEGLWGVGTGGMILFRDDAY